MKIDGERDIEKMVLAKLIYTIICLVPDVIISPIYYN
jgi:hypothetical protein